MLNATPAPGFAAFIDSFALYLEGIRRSPPHRHRIPQRGDYVRPLVRRPRRTGRAR
jgi:hypothetical protein